MKTALDPHTGQMTTVSSYAERYGSKLNAYGDPNVRPPARCPGCKHTMHTVGENSAGMADAVFAHDRGTNGFEPPWCPLKQSASWLYERLTPTRPDAFAGKALRASFMSNWQLHWSLIREYVLHPDIHAFVKAVQFADSKRIWEHRGLREELLPYIFMTLIEFAPPQGKLAGTRTETVRFRFDGTVRSIEDLWFRTTGAFELIELVFEAPTPPATVASKFIDNNPVGVDFGFLTRAPTFVPWDYQVNQFQLAFLI